METLKYFWPLLAIVGTIILTGFSFFVILLRQSFRVYNPTWERMLKKQKKEFTSILLKNYVKLNSYQKTEILCLFDVWQKTYSTLFSESTTDTKKRRDDLLKKSGKMYLYNPYLFSSDPPSQENTEIFLKDVFTHTYPSDGHDDFGNHSMHIKFAELMILKGISKNDTKKYYVHLKRRFVNHTIVRGIIQMDIYILK